MKRIAFFTCLLFAATTQSQEGVSIEQCKAWYKEKKRLEDNHGGIRNRERIRQITSLQIKHRCPTRHNKYYE